MERPSSLVLNYFKWWGLLHANHDLTNELYKWWIRKKNSCFSRRKKIIFMVSIENKMKIFYIYTDNEKFTPTNQNKKHQPNIIRISLLFWSVFTFPHCVKTFSIVNQSFFFIFRTVIISFVTILPLVFFFFFRKILINLMRLYL